MKKANIVPCSLLGFIGLQSYVDYAYFNIINKKLTLVDNELSSRAVQQWLVQLKGHQQWNQGDTGSS